VHGAELLYEGASLVHHSDHNRTGVSREVLNDLRETEHSASPAHGLDRGSVWTAAQNGSGALVYEAFGVFGSALQEKIGVFHAISLQTVPKTPTHRKRTVELVGVRRGVQRCPRLEKEKESLSARGFKRVGTAARVHYVRM
jgi:hypothetical protein